MRRRTFIKAAGAGTTAIAAGLGLSLPRINAALAEGTPAQTVLPVGNAPIPVPTPHFPSRAHAFIWRNWPLVPAERLARVLGATPAQIQRVAKAMGLGKQERITKEQQRRSHLTVIKRNWHLLPYEQLLTLLGWSAEELAYTLREDDFLYVKLGRHKPRCETLRWREEDGQASERKPEIRRVVQEYFPDGVASREPLFHFVDALSERRWWAKQPAAQSSLRLCYSYFALYGDPLLEPDLDPYPDGYLARLAECGVNAVWLQGILHKLAPFPWQPDLSSRYQERLANLARLVARAKKRGIAIYLYLNEPRSMPQAFFVAHPELKGAPAGDYAALCTRAPGVTEWMRQAVASLCRAVPDLGGFFTITASENLTSCWSHGGGANCPRCRTEAPASVIAGVNRAIHEGIEEAFRDEGSQSPRPQLIAWDWGWNDAWAADVIRQLPDGCAFMSVSEWNLPIERGGIKTTVGEYSISSIGPGPRAQRHWGIARQRGLKIIAKIQAGNTWELSSVPYIPALRNVAQHAVNLRAAGVQDVMLGWTLGGYPSPNLEIVQKVLEKDSTIGVDDAMRAVAERRFGKHADAVLASWNECSAGFSEFPYHGGVVYSAPQQVGPANLLLEKPSGYPASMVGFPYDDLNGWRAIYPPETFAVQMEKVARGFARGADLLRRALQASGSGAKDKALSSELRVTQAAGIHFASVVNQVRFVMARDALRKASTASAAETQLGELERLVREELRLAQELHRLQRLDSRIGFEATNQYYYVPTDLAEKVLNCRDLLERWLPAQRKRWKDTSQ